MDNHLEDRYREERLNFAAGNAAEKEEDGLENCEDADLFAASLEDGENV